MVKTLLFLGCVLWFAQASLFGQATADSAKLARWKQHVSAADRGRVNPEQPKPESVAAGEKLYSQFCARCHGADANGKGKKPSLRTADTTQATDGELFWLLTNGDIAHGMPAWPQMPAPERWQVITYLRSLAASATQGTQP